MDPLISDDFFRLCHHDSTGKALLHPFALSTGLAAALLADLIWSGHAFVRDSDLWLVAQGQPPPPDRVSSKVFHMLLRERHPLPTWLKFLATASVSEVTARLVESGHLQRTQARRGLRSTVAYVPTDLLEAARPRAVLATRLMNDLPLDGTYLVVGGLMAATGLDAHVLSGSSEGRAYLRRLMARTDTAMQDLFAHTEAAVGAAVLANRT